MISKTQTPLPTAQIAVLMITRLAEPISYTVIFPFINQMVEELGVTDNPDRVGFYSGLIEAVFSFVQFFTVYHWAKLSDKIGRKPVIFIGLTGVAISGSLFGLSKTFWFMIVVRCLSGALNGNVAVIKAAIGDITDETNSTDAFALYGLTWTVGAIVGNAMGGYLSHPYEQIPSLFGTVTLFKTYPYLLPCLVAAGMTLLGIVFCHIYYTESVPSPSSYRRSSKSLSLKDISHRRSSSVISDTDTLVDQSTERLLAKSPNSPDTPMMPGDKDEWGFWDLMAYKPVQILSTTMFMNSFVGGAWAAGSLLFFFDKRNGLSMSPSAIGTASALNGLWTVVAQLTMLNRIRRWLGISRAYKTLTFGWIIVWLLLPNLRTLMEMTETPLPRSHPHEPLLYPPVRGWITSIGVNLMLSFVTIVGLSNSLLMVLINFSSPDRSALGAVNGISTAVGCMARVLGPSSIGALFAISMDGKVLGGRLWWIFMVIMSTVNFVTCLFVSPDRDSQARSPTWESQTESGEEDQLV